MLCHLLFLWEFLPERRFAIFPKGVLAIWKNRETFSSLPASSLCLRASSEAGGRSSSFRFCPVVILHPVVGG